MSAPRPQSCANEVSRCVWQHRLMRSSNRGWSSGNEGNSIWMCYLCMCLCVSVFVSVSGVCVCVYPRLCVGSMCVYQRQYFWYVCVFGMCVCVCVWLSECVCVCVCVWLCSCIRVCVCVIMCMHACSCVCVCVIMCIHACMWAIFGIFSWCKIYSSPPSLSSLADKQAFLAEPVICLLVFGWLPNLHSCSAIFEQPLSCSKSLSCSLSLQCFVYLFSFCFPFDRAI